MDTTREGQRADLYSRAIEQLGSDKIDVRIGGIYALERVARESAADHPTVMEVLSAFIREHSREPCPSPEPDDEPKRSTQPDVQAALTVVGRRDAERDIRPISLGGVMLARADLTDANLFRANLTDADLTDADLTDADLTSANLAGANLTDACLTNADLRFANLTGADFTSAGLTGANLAGADLTGADLPFANLAGAYLTGAALRGANLDAARWSRSVPAPEGWELDIDRSGAGQLRRAGADPGPAEAD